MKSMDLISAIQERKIIASQALGMIRTVVEEKPTYFLAGSLYRVEIEPALEPSLFSTFEINFSDYSEYKPTNDGILYRWKEGLSHNVVINEADEVYSKRNDFQKEMNRFMKKVETKDNFPIFVRDLSKLKWR